jgi:hypothetical protein
MTETIREMKALQPAADGFVYGRRAAFALHSVREDGFRTFLFRCRSGHCPTEGETTCTPWLPPKCRRWRCISATCRTQSAAKIPKAACMKRRLGVSSRALKCCAHAPNLLQGQGVTIVDGFRASARFTHGRLRSVVGHNCPPVRVLHPGVALVCREAHHVNPDLPLPADDHVRTALRGTDVARRHPRFLVLPLVTVLSALVCFCCQLASVNSAPGIELERLIPCRSPP